MTMMKMLKKLADKDKLTFYTINAVTSIKHGEKGSEVTFAVDDEDGQRVIEARIGKGRHIVAMFVVDETDRFAVDEK